MEQEHSAGAIIFYYNKNESQPYFLLLKYTNYWGFPKGLIEQNEQEEETAKREIKEESGINANFIKGFKENQKWFFRSKQGSLIKKECVYFLSEISKDESKHIKISEEHEDFKFITLENSKKYIKIKSNKDLLQKAYNFIKEYKKQKKLF